MFWVLQDNLYNEGAFQDLLNALERSETPYQIVKVIPFIHTFEPDINPTGPVMVCGATSLRNNAKTRGWNPGYFDENLDYRLYIKYYGTHMFNYDSVVLEMKYITKVWDEFFIRPILDSKSFSGQIMHWDEFDDWRNKVHAIRNFDEASTLTTDDLVVMSPIKKIYSEYRFFVVDGKVITGSLYKQGTQILYDGNVPEPVTEFAQQMVDIWSPNKAFCLDICFTPDGFKIMEINAINSAGFYKCDMYKFVEAINNLENKKNNED